jgi:hypothetical protein
MTEPISRIEAALAGLGAEHEPPAGWEARVLAATAAPRSRRWWWWLGAPLVAAIAVLLWLVPRGPSADLVYTATSERVDRGRTRGEPGNIAHVGDTLHLTASSRGTYREIRVYRDDHLELRCPGGSGCRGADAAEIALLRSGTYELMALAASEPIPPPGGSLDIDRAAADRAGVKIQNTHLTVD